MNLAVLEKYEVGYTRKIMAVAQTLNPKLLATNAMYMCL